MTDQVRDIVADDAGQSRGYLRQVGELLWPPPATLSLGQRGRPRAGPASPRAAGLRRDFILLPSASRPRLVVPAGRHAAAAAVRGYGQPGSRTVRLGSRVLPVLLASGAGGLALRGRLSVRGPEASGGIESYLATVLGTHVLLSLHLGAPRANRKPVLQLLTARGEHVGFAKIGVNTLTSELIRAEHGALSRLGTAGLTRLTVPAVRHFGSWRGLDVLVLSALPAWRRRRQLPAGQLTAAMAELADVDGTTREPLASSPYWQQLTGRVTAAGERPDRTALLAALGAVAAQAGGTVLGFGAWHGDWTPWNMASTADGLLVWDWERFGTGAPLGFDALHYWLQSAVVPGSREPAAAASSCVAGAPELLARFGADQPQARLTAILYLAELAARYLTDRQDEGSLRLGTPGTWLIPALAKEVTRL
jgi:hypothetical protein